MKQLSTFPFIGFLGYILWCAWIKIETTPSWMKLRRLLLLFMTLVMWFCWAKMLLLAWKQQMTCVVESNKPRLATTKSSNAAIKNARKGRGFTLNHHYPRFLNRKIANLRGFMAMLYSSTCLLCHMPEIVLGPVLPYKALKSFLLPTKLSDFTRNIATFKLVRA